MISFFFNIEPTKLLAEIKKLKSGFLNLHSLSQLAGTNHSNHNESFHLTHKLVYAKHKNKSSSVATIPTSIAAIKLKNSVTSNTLTSTKKYEISCLIFEKRPKKNDRRMFLPFASSKRNERTADTLAKTGMGNRFKNGAKNKIVAP